MVINKEEAKEWIPILQAFVDGKTLQMKTPILEYDEEESKYKTVWVDVNTTELLPMSHYNHSDMSPTEYRIKEC